VEPEIQTEELSAETALRELNRLRLKHSKSVDSDGEPLPDVDFIDDVVL
jgi:hypothetical protein